MQQFTKWWGCPAQWRNYSLRLRTLLTQTMASVVKNPRCWIDLLFIGYITKSRHCSWWLAMLMDFNSNWNTSLLVLSYPILHSLSSVHLSDLYIGLRIGPDLKAFIKTQFACISSCKHASYLWTRLVISVKRFHVNEWELMFSNSSLRYRTAFCLLSIQANFVVLHRLAPEPQMAQCLSLQFPVKPKEQLVLQW